MPPSKVGDLRIRALEDGHTFLAVWTAPGDDYDHGAVSGYRFVRILKRRLGSLFKLFCK